MNRKEYLVLCDACAALNIALCAMNPKHNIGFVNASKTAHEETLNAFRLIDKITIDAAKKNPKLDEPSPKEKKALDKELEEHNWFVELKG